MYVETSESDDWCTVDDDCPSGACENGYCRRGCQDDTHCPSGEWCDSGRCVPDHLPQPECQVSADCADGLICVNARCREACTCDADCGTGATCESGFCISGHEQSPECVSNADCAAGESCANGRCQN